MEGLIFGILRYMPCSPGRKMFVTRLFRKEYRISISRMTPNKIFMFLITPPPAEMLKYIETNSKTRIRMFKRKKRGRWQKIKTLGLN